MTIVRSTRRAAIIIGMMGTLFQCSSKSNPIDEADREFAASTCQGLASCNPVFRDAFFGSDTGCREAMFELVDRSDDESQATLESVETCNNWLFSIVKTCSFQRITRDPPAECFGTAIAKKGVSLRFVNIGEACTPTPESEKDYEAANYCKYGPVCQAGADGSATCVARGKEGESCKPNKDDQRTCSSDLYCNKTSSKCVEPKVGDSCETSGEAVECGPALVCIRDACSAPIEAGGKCSDDLQCKSLACVEDTCVKQTLVALGSSCGEHRDLICDVSSYCHERKRLPAIARGQPCEPNPGPPFGPPCSGIDRCLGGICQATTLQGIFASALE